MFKNRVAVDISDEFIVTPWHSGVKLSRPSTTLLDQSTALSVKSVLQMPMNVYFLGSDSTIINLNQETVDVCRFPDKKQAIGATVSLVATEETTTISLNHDQEVMQQKTLVIKEQIYTCFNDGFATESLSFKFPLFDHSNKLVGVFGCSVMIEVHSLVGALHELIQLGLLSKYTRLPGKQKNEIYLTQRELECLVLIVRGKTTKLVGKILQISPRTVEQYIVSLKLKFNVNCKSELIDVAIAQGYAHFT